MINAVKEMNKQQIEFIEKEFGIDSDSLTVLDEDKIYEKIYDPCCVIEEVETVATLDDNTELSERGKIASEIVTLLGNEID